MSRLIIIFILAAAAYVLIKGLMAVAFFFRAKSKQGPRAVTGRPMVQDPICGTYVPKENALEASIGGEVRYFCSPECLEKSRAAESGSHRTEEGR